MDSERKRAILRAAARVARTAAVAAVLAFIARHVYLNWQDLMGREWTVRPLPLALAVLALCAGMVYMGMVWAVQARGAGVEAGFWRATGGALVANLGKYLPGKVWTVMGRAYFLARDGAELRSAGALSLLSQLAMVVAGAYFALLAAPLLLGGGLAWLLPVTAAFALGGTAALHPRLYVATIDRALRLTGRRELGLAMPYRRVLWWIALSVSIWVPFGLGFWALVAAFAPVGVEEAPALAGTLALAGTAGLVAVFAPAGVGVREGVLMALLPQMIGTEAAIVVGLGSRLWFTAAELACAGLGIAILGRGALREAAARPDAT